MLLQKLFICFLRKTCCSFVLVMTAFVCTYSGEVSSDHMWSTDACGDGLWCRCKLSSRRDAYWELYHLWMDHPGHALMPGANWRKVIPSQWLSQDLPRTLANKWEKQDISLTKAIFVFQGCQVETLRQRHCKTADGFVYRSLISLTNWRWLCSFNYERKLKLSVILRIGKGQTSLEIKTKLKETQIRKDKTLLHIK